MLELPHTLVGIAIATKLNNPALSLPLAFTSHFALDFIPHWNPHLNQEINKHGRITKLTTAIVIIDVVISLVAGLAIAYMNAQDIESFITIIFGGFLAVLPDVVEAPYYFFGFRSLIIARWVRFQTNLQCNIPLLPGVLTQLIIIGASVWWLIN